MIVPNQSQADLPSGKIFDCNDFPVSIIEEKDDYVIINKRKVTEVIVYR